MQWFKAKVEEVSSKSRTAALWLSYTHYIEIGQQFIKAVRTNNFARHYSTTKQMINLFAGTAHYNYANNCRLYLQSIEELKKVRPQVAEHFGIGNHTVRRTRII
mgnify:CR=1 FL=1